MFNFWCEYGFDPGQKRTKGIFDRSKLKVTRDISPTNSGWLLVCSGCVNSVTSTGCTHTDTQTHTTILQLSGFCPGQPVVINHHLSTSSIYYDPRHPPCSIHTPDSLFPQSFSEFSLFYLLALQLGEIVEKDCEACKFYSEYAMDHKRWRKQIRDD